MPPLAIQIAEVIVNVPVSGTDIQLSHIQNPNIILVWKKEIWFVDRISQGVVGIPNGVLVNQTVKITAADSVAIFLKTFDHQPNTSPTSYIMSPVIDITVLENSGQW